MSLTDVIDLNFDYEEVFLHISFQIDTDCKPGFIGRKRKTDGSTF